MKNLYPRLFSFVLLVCLFANKSKAQNITVDNSLLANGPYGQGCSIAVPVAIDGCFNTNNIFRVYLSDASGNFATETLIGSYTAFYTTFVNGVIPTTKPAGSGYKVRVKSTSPVVTSAASAAIQINTYAATLNSLADPQLSSRILSPQLAYGWCSSVQQQTGFVMINGSTTGAVATATIKNEVNGSIQSNLPYDASNQLSLDLNRHYYTFINKAAKDGVIATKAYFIINSPNKLGLSTDGEQQGCLPDTLTFQMGTDTTSGIGNNFPGIRYQIDWGDGTALEVFTQCNLMSAAGILKHYYVGVSCGKPNITFNVTTTLLNPWFNNSGTATQRNCDQPQVVSRAKIFKKPEAKFSFPNPACVNTPVTFANNTDPGQAQFGTQCINKADYRWYINGVLVQTNIQATPPPSMTYTFTATGKYEIKLMVDNGSCEISTKIDSICIEPKPTPDFKMNGVDSLASCAPLNITTTNLTPNNAVCQTMGFAWLVIDSLGNTIAPGTGVFTISPNNTDKTPSFVFLKEGKYKIRLTVTNVCGGIVKDKPVIIIGTTKSTLPSDKAYCGKQTINFFSDANHKPDYNITIGAETYGWVITGGSYSFVGGTSASSPYPQVKFNDYGTYTVKVNFSNMCGTSTSTQLITFNEPVTAAVTSNKNVSICYNDSTINVTATSSGPADSTRWFTTGTGNFVNRNLLSTTYKLSNADKLAGSIKLYFKTFIQKPTACNDVSDTINVTILPHNHITSDTTKKICSGTSIAYLPTALISGSTFNWTSSIVSGTVTGNTAIGSSNINDVLTNTSNSADAIVRYIITPTKATCVGDTFSFYAIVKPLPDLTATAVADTVCSGNNAVINIGSSAANIKYTWSSAVSGGTVTGNTNQATQVTATSISNALVNSGTTYATVTYTIKVFGETGCEGQTKTVKVVVRPNPTIADAGLDKKICNQTGITLAGNNPAAGTGVWTQAAGPAVIFTNPNLYNTTVSGLVGDNTYRFVWSINAGGTCGAVTDTVTIINRPVVTIANAGTDIAICDFNSSSSNTTTLGGNLNSTRTYETGIWSIYSQPTGGNGGFSLLSNPNAIFTFQKVGNYKLVWTISNDVGCTPSSDTVEINVYPKPVAGVTAPTNAITCNGTDVTINLQSYTGIIKKWQYNTNPISDNIWKDTLVTNPTITFQNLQDTILVRCIVSGGGEANGCPSFDTSVYSFIAVNPKTLGGNTNDDAVVCKGDNSGIIALTNNTGTVQRWEFSINNGTNWFMINNTTATQSYSNLTTNTIYRAVVQSGVCPPKYSDTTSITVVEPVSTSNAGVDQKVCNQSSIILNGSTPVNGTGTWLQVNGNPISFTNSSLSNTTVTGLQGNQLYKFVWKITGLGNCPPSIDTVVVINRPATTQANAGIDKTICDFTATTNNNILLNANIDNTRTFETGKWNVIEQPTSSSAYFDNDTKHDALFTFSKSGTYKLEWAISNDAGCPPTKDTIIINVFDKPIAGTVAGSPITACFGSTVTASINSFTGNIKKWQYNPAPFNDNIWIDATGTNSTINFNNAQDSFAVRVIIESTGAAFGCNSTAVSDSVIFNITPKTVPGKVTGNAAVCELSNAGNINLTNYAGNIVKWQSSIDNGLSWIDISSTASTINYNNLNNTIWYRAAVQSGVCPTLFSDTAIVTVAKKVTTAMAGLDKKLCGVTSIQLNGNNGATTETGLWQQVSGPSTTNIVTANASSTTVNGLTDGVYKFQWILSNNVCPSSADTVEITNRPVTTQANAGIDKTVCDFTATTNTNILLSGNLDNTRPFETGKWNVIEQPTSSSAYLDDNTKRNALFTFSKSGVYKLEWVISNDAGCPPTKDTIIINVFDKPIAGVVAGSPITACYGSTVSASINSFTGNIKKWQYNPAPFNDNIWIDATGTNSTINFNNAQDSFAVRVVIESAGAAFGCNSVAVSDSVIFNITPKTVPGKVTGNATVCELSNAGNINLTNYAGNIVKWQSSIDNGLSWIDISTTASIVNYNNLPNTIWYRASVQSGVCPTLFSDTAIITVAKKVTPAIAGLDKQLCGETSVQLSGNGGTSTETGLWQQVSGPSTANIVTANTASTTVNGLIDGVYKFEWVLSNNVCPSTKDTVVITNFPSLQNTINTGNIIVCNGQPVNITGYTAVGGNGTYTYQWQQSVDSINWVNIASANSINYSFVATDTLFIRRVVSSDPCNKISDVIKVLVQKPITNNLIGNNQSICINTVPLLVTGTLPGGADGNYQYQWQQSTDGGNTWNDITSATTRDYQPTALTQSIRYRRIVVSQLCNGQQQSISTVVSITVNPDAKAQWSITHTTDCAPFNINTTVINTSVYPDKNGVYEWYVNGNLLGTGENFPGYIITTANDSIVVKLKTVSKFGCINDSVSTKFYTIPKPVPAFDITDTIGCGPLSISFANNTANIPLYHFKWDFGNGQISTQPNPATIVFNQAIANVDTVYTIRMSAYTTCDSITVNKSIRVQSKPTARFLPSKITGCSPMTVTFINTSIAAVATYYWDFGDGTTIVATDKNSVQHTFYTGTATMFNVKLKVTNGCGSDSLIYPIDVQQNSILLNFNIANDNKGCVPYTAKFINGSIGATGFNWDFGDGTVINTVKNLDTIYHTYYTVGDYTPILKATNGCSDTTGNRLLFANRKPIVNFTALPTTICLGDSVHFTNLTDTATTYVWKFDDGFTSNQFSPVHAYNIAGVFTAKLQATRIFNNGGACVDSSDKIVTVLTKQPGAFNVSDTLGKCTPFSVTFTNLSMPSSLTTWDYGNGIVDTGDVVIHTFNTVGTYTVKLNAQSIGGCKYEAQRTIKVQGPSGNFNYDNGFICGNKPVRFETNTQNVDSIKWNFGDGNTFVTTGNIVYHAFTQSGVYIPKVELIAGGTCRVPLTGIDTVKVDYIKAGYTSTIQNYCGYSTVDFMDTSRTYFGVSQYYWTFGDGGTSSIASPQHQYSTTNTWATQLVIKTNSGCFDTAYNPLFLQIPQLPHAAIQSDTVGCVNETLHFNAVVNSLDPVGYYKWNFTNGVTTANTTVATQFPVAGVQTAQLIIGTTNGCYDTTYKQVRINPNPFVKTNQDMQICRGQSTMLNATGASNYNWSPTQNLSCSTCGNTLSAPQSTTQYVVSGTNQFGCSGYDTVIVNVAQPFAISITSNDTLCLGQSTTLHAQGAYSYQWFPSGGLTSTTASAPIASPTITTKYRVIGLDEFNCFRDTAYVTVAVGQYPLVNIGPDKVLQTGDYLPLKATFTNGPITQWHWGSGDFNCTTCAEPVALIKNNTCYYVEAKNQYGCAGRDTMCVKVFFNGGQVFIPNAFTPDGDGINDVFMVRGKGIKTVKSFRIFNRWGQVVFEKANFAANDARYGWDGRVNGILATPDVFVYTCDVVAENDEQYSTKGNVTILK